MYTPTLMVTSLAQILQDFQKYFCLQLLPNLKNKSKFGKFLASGFYDCDNPFQYLMIDKRANRVQTKNELNGLKNKTN